jgi:non-ribosomal peptide synthase protein (TIGR01720 family)
VAHPTPDPRSLIPELRAFLKEKLPDYMVPTVFIALDTLPLNQNGKVNRKALPAPADTRPDLGAPFVAPRTLAERALAAVWMRVLRLKQVGVHDNFFELGGDSILSMQIVARATQAGLHITVKQIFEHQTIAELATVATSAPGSVAEQSAVSGPVALIPIQHWFFERIQTDRHHWNMSLLLETQPDANPLWLNQITQRLVEHHDALRICFSETATGWQQFNTPPGTPVPFAWVDLAALSAAQSAHMIEAVTTALQTSFRLDQAPLMRVAFFQMGAGQPGRIFIVIHHLIVDSVSWRVLLDDFQTAYQQLSAGEPVQFPLKTTSYQRWAERQLEYAQSDELRQQLDYWRTLLADDLAPLPRDFPDGVNATASTRFAPVLLSPEDTRLLLQDVSRVYDTQAHEVLLTALGCAIARWTGAPALINVEGHGRVDLFEDVDMTRTTGWCPSISPVVFRLNEADTPLAALALVKQQLNQVPQQGIGYGLLRYLCADPAVAEQLRALPSAEIMFNYHGQFDQVISPDSIFRGGAQELIGPNSSAGGTRFILLFVQGSVLQGQMNFVFHYSGNIYRQATIQAVAETFREVLLWFIDRVRSTGEATAGEV